MFNILNSKTKFISEIGYVFQDPDIQLIGLDVENDIQFGPLNLGWSIEKVNYAVVEAMKSCDVYHLREKNPFKLSFGEKRRIAIAGVVAMDSTVILLDEPTTWLDPLHKEELRILLEKLRDMGKTVIMTTHDLDFAKVFNGNYIYLNSGKVIFQGDVESLKDRELLKTCKLLK